MQRSGKWIDHAQAEAWKQVAGQEEEKGRREGGNRGRSVASRKVSDLLLEDWRVLEGFDQGVT